MDYDHDAPPDILDMLAIQDHHAGFDINLAGRTRHKNFEHPNAKSWTNWRIAFKLVSLDTERLTLNQSESGG